ncbi:MAG: hypothetical protein R2697_11075 [Ilumatobacteraceae bacterium]
MWAIFAGRPATAFPGGLDPRGLPLGLQAIGPYLEDRTTMRFAGQVEEWNGFVAAGVHLSRHGRPGFKMSLHNADKRRWTLGPPD